MYLMRETSLDHAYNFWNTCKESYTNVAVILKPFRTMLTLAWTLGSFVKLQCDKGLSFLLLAT